jgi:hypothetical protein
MISLRSSCPSVGPPVAFVRSFVGDATLAANSRHHAPRVYRVLLEASCGREDSSRGKRRSERDTKRHFVGPRQQRTASERATPRATRARRSPVLCAGGATRAGGARLGSRAFPLAVFSQRTDGLRSCVRANFEVAGYHSGKAIDSRRTVKEQKRARAPTRPRARRAAPSGRVTPFRFPENLGETQSRIPGFGPAVGRFLSDRLPRPI